MKRSVSLIVPTTLSLERAPLLGRALRSLQEHQHHVIVPIVVANGTRYLPEVLESLKQRQDITFVASISIGTYMALKLALTKTPKFLDVPTYRWYRGTPESLSATKGYRAAEPEAIREMLKLN